MTSTHANFLVSFDDPGNSMWQLSREIQKNRELIWALALKELQVRYKRSALGFLWALLNPLLMMIILTMVFSTVMRVPVHDYPVFLISALLPWTFFSQRSEEPSELQSPMY